MRKQKIFIALGIILIIILVLLAISRKNSSQTSTNSESSLGPNDQIVNLLNQDSQSETESIELPSPPINEETEEPDHQSGSNLFDLTEIKLIGQQKQIFQVIQKFEEAFNQRDFPKAFEYFDSQVRNKGLETQITSQDIIEPISFKVLQINIRNDGTALAEVKEIRKEGSPLQRYFEFAPQADKFLITSYYDPAKVEVYSGFQL